MPQVRLSEPIELPGDFWAIFLAGRPQMAAMIAPDRTLSVEETKSCARAIGVLSNDLQTKELQRQQLVTDLEVIRSALCQSYQAIRFRVTGLETMINQLKEKP